MSRTVDLAVTRLTKVVSIADPTAPKLTELNAVTSKDLSTQMSKAYDVGPDKSDSVSEMGVTDVAKSETPTVRAYHGMLEFFRDYDDTGAPTTDDCTTLIAENELFYFIRRTGKPHTAAYAAGDIVEVYLFRADLWDLPSGTGSGNLKGKIPLWQQGVIVTQAVVAT